LHAIYGRAVVYKSWDESSCPGAGTYAKYTCVHVQKIIVNKMRDISNISILCAIKGIFILNTIKVIFVCHKFI